MPAAAEVDYGQTVGVSFSARELWGAVDRLIDRADVDGIVAHKLGPLAAIRWRATGRPLPPRLADEERAASLAMLSAPPLLRRIRDACDGPLVLLKGPELAHLYPPKGRRFGDVDVLTPDAAALHRALTRNGFVEMPDPDFDHGEHHHLVPLRWPVIALNVEVHTLPNWPVRVPPPPLDEIFEAAVPSALEIDGLSTPDPLHQALVLAAHAWRHEPLHTLRDLVDVAAASAGRDAGELDRAAAAWGIDRIWRTTRRATEALFFDRPPPVPLRVWARHLGAVRERTVLESHLQRWLGPFWGLPAAAALMESGRVLRQDMTPEAGESWRDKLGRVPRAIQHAGVALSDRPDPPRTGGGRGDDRPPNVAG